MELRSKVEGLKNNSFSIRIDRYYYLLLYLYRPFLHYHAKEIIALFIDSHSDCMDMSHWNRVIMNTKSSFKHELEKEWLSVNRD